MRREALAVLLLAILLVPLFARTRIYDVRAVIQQGPPHLLNISWKAEDFRSDLKFRIVLLDSRGNYYCTLERNYSPRSPRVPRPVNSPIGPVRRTIHGPVTFNYTWTVYRTCKQDSGREKPVGGGYFRVKVSFANPAWASIYGISNSFTIPMEKLFSVTPELELENLQLRSQSRLPVPARNMVIYNYVLKIQSVPFRAVLHLNIRYLGNEREKKKFVICGSRAPGARISSSLTVAPYYAFSLIDRFAPSFSSSFRTTRLPVLGLISQNPISETQYICYFFAIRSWETGCVSDLYAHPQGNLSDLLKVCFTLRN